MQLRQPVDQCIDVAIGVVPVLRWQRVRGEIGGAHADAQQLADAPRDAKHLALVLEVKPVAGLDLQRGHTVVQQRAGTRQRLPQQLVLVGLP